MSVCRLCGAAIRADQYRFGSPRTGWEHMPGDCDGLADLDQLIAERDRLAAWKAEAMTVLGQWDRVWEAAGKPGLLGGSTAEATLSRVKAWAEMLPVPARPPRPPLPPEGRPNTTESL